MYQDHHGMTLSCFKSILFPSILISVLASDLSHSIPVSPFLKLMEEHQSQVFSSFMTNDMDEVWSAHVPCEHNVALELAMATSKWVIVPLKYAHHVV
jgi:hypothetical protein